MKKLSINKYITVSLLSGMIIGCILFLLFIIYNTGIIDYFNQTFFSDIYFGGRNINKEECIYIIRYRILQIIFFIVMCYFISYSKITVIYNFFFGLIYGFIYCSLFFQFGLKSLVKIILYIFPCFFLYLLFIKLFDEWIERFIVNKENAYYKNVNIKKIFLLLLIFSVFILGLFLEIYSKNIYIFFTNI